MFLKTYLDLHVFTYKHNYVGQWGPLVQRMKERNFSEHICAVRQKLYFILFLQHNTASNCPWIINTLPKLSKLPTLTKYSNLGCFLPHCCLFGTSFINNTNVLVLQWIYLNRLMNNTNVFIFTENVYSVFKHSTVVEILFRV